MRAEGPGEERDWGQHGEGDSEESGTVRGPGLGPAGPGAPCGAGAGPRRCPVPPCPPQAAEEREWRRRAARLWAEMERERRMDEALRAVSAAGAAALGEGEAEGNARLALPLAV